MTVLLAFGSVLGGSLVAQDTVPRHETFEIHSRILDEKRVICVWLPPGYVTSGDAVPVLYMPDGGVGEDFPHIANTIASLIQQKTLAPMLVVGIENTERRRDLTGPSDNPEDAKIAPLPMAPVNSERS